MKITYKRFAFLALMLVIVVFTLLTIVFSRQAVQSEFDVLITFFVNIMLFTCMFIVAVNRNSFSLDMMFWLFNLIFFGAAPLLQYKANVYAWNLSPTSEEIIKTNIFIFIWSICYILGRRIKIFRREDTSNLRKRARASDNYKYEIRDIVLNCFVIVSVVITGYFIIRIGFGNLLYRETSELSGLSQTEALIVTHVFKNLILFTALFSVLDAKNKKKVTVRSIIVLLCLLIGCFPTGLARNMTASFYAGLFIVLYDKTRKGRWFSLVIFAGLILVFPAINIFRHVGNSGNIWQAIKETFQVTYLEGNYDAHQMIISVQRYVEKFGLEYFSQIIGAALFFIPRTLWPSKPVGTGHTVVTKLNQFYFTNVSAPLVSEFYIAFGIIGIIIGGLILGKILKIIDNAYWENNNAMSAIRIIYPCAIFMFFFMLRGDLLSSWAYTFAQIIVGLSVWYLVVKKTK